jgi:hypothetical protein
MSWPGSPTGSPVRPPLSAPTVSSGLTPVSRAACTPERAAASTSSAVSRSPSRGSANRAVRAAICPANVRGVPAPAARGRRVGASCGGFRSFPRANRVWQFSPRMSRQISILHKKPDVGLRLDQAPIANEQSLEDPPCHLDWDRTPTCQTSHAPGNGARGRRLSVRSSAAPSSNTLSSRQGRGAKDDYCQR